MLVLSRYKAQGVSKENCTQVMVLLCTIPLKPFFPSWTNGTPPLTHGRGSESSVIGLYYDSGRLLLLQFQPCIQDLDELERLLKCYQGAHNYRAFAGAIEQLEKKAVRSVDTVRTVLYTPWICFQKAIACTGTASIFSSRVRSMNEQVRNMVGTTVNTWMARMSEETFRWLLARMAASVTRDDNPPKPAPPDELNFE
jgi:tRNA U38,U39,U40 pseudouridine synthase TruA